MVQTAAVIGREFTFAVLARASGQDEAAVVQSLDELWRRQLVREQGMDAYDFSHDKIRAETYAGLSSLRRRLLHRQVAETLAEIHAPDLDLTCIQIARHFESAGFASPEEEPPEWDEHGDDLADLAALRNDILQGDLRSLYLASLLGIVTNLYLDNDEGEAEAELEPSVPPGLGQLTPALEAFIRFMRIDPFLVAAAAEASAPLAAASSASLAATIAQLPRTECDAFLQRLLQGEANLQVVLQRRLQEPLPASLRKGVTLTRR